MSNRSTFSMLSVVAGLAGLGTKPTLRLTTDPEAEKLARRKRQAEFRLPFATPPEGASSLTLAPGSNRAKRNARRRQLSRNNRATQY